MRKSGPASNIKSGGQSRKRFRLRQLARARRELTHLEEKTREFARNTVAAAEFIAETVRAESRYFAHRAVDRLTERLIGFEQSESKQGLRNHDSLEALAGISLHANQGSCFQSPFKQTSAKQDE